MRRLAYATRTVSLLDTLMSRHDRVAREDLLDAAGLLVVPKGNAGRRRAGRAQQSAPGPWRLAPEESRKRMEDGHHVRARCTACCSDCSPASQLHSVWRPGAAVGTAACERRCRRLLAATTELPWRAVLITVIAVAMIIGWLSTLWPYYHVFGTDRTGNDVLYQALKSIRTAVRHRHAGHDRDAAAGDRARHSGRLFQRLGRRWQSSTSTRCFRRFRRSC